MNLSEHVVHAASDTRDTASLGVHDVPSLAFDHPMMLRRAFDREL